MASKRSRNKSKPNNYPAISVVVSTYNRADFFLPRAIDSILEQDFKDFEIIIADDCSTDNTFKVVESYDKKFREKGIPLRYFKLNENSGYQCKPKNHAINFSWGDYIAYLDDDNVWKEDHLSELYKAIFKEQADMVYGLREYKNYNLSKAKLKKKKLLMGVDWTAKDRVFNAESIAAGNFIDTSDILHSKGAMLYLLEKTGWMWNEDLMRFADWNLVHRWALMGLSCKCVPKVLTEYWWHKENLQLTRPVTEGPVILNATQWESMRV